MKQEDFERAKEIENLIAELTLMAEKDIQVAKHLESGSGSVHVNFGIGLRLEQVVLDKEAMKVLSEFYYKRHNDIQKQIGELKKEFYNI